jgi:hypothetical protein
MINLAVEAFKAMLRWVICCFVMFVVLFVPGVLFIAFLDGVPLLHGTGKMIFAFVLVQGATMLNIYHQSRNKAGETPRPWWKQIEEWKKTR